ncbi:MAG: hypothetical protein Hyperionvirus12_48 [Hyperionvirus sp.]|uniref:Sel1 repeat family protein n=1 Tax=Hyperionvirus sp. TaxID=2487770 RepID=A0A3G5AC50_9VIRU|nr:MAG: hypothetical protein Hyperionvirus12_48 [Hyperionvirus sp.]
MQYYVVQERYTPVDISNEKLDQLLQATLTGDMDSIQELRNVTNNSEVDSEVAIKIFKFFDQYSSTGDPIAQYFLGKFNIEGYGTTKNMAEGCKLALLSAHAGFPGGSNLLGNCYENGFCLPKNDSEAFKLYFEASSKGFIGAYSNLARAYDQGIGAPPDISKAYHWYKMAILHGDKTGDICTFRDLNCFANRFPQIQHQILHDIILSQKTLSDLQNQVSSQAKQIQNLQTQLSTYTVEI